MKLLNITNFLILLSLVSFSACNTPTTKKDLPPPNIVWITSEDNSKHYMEMFDKGGVATPNIERLAKHGVIYDYAFSNAPVCSSARSTLISGCYGPRIAAHYHRRIEQVPMPEGVEMYPAYLKRAGYYTTNNAKEDYNLIKGDSVWDMSSKKASWRNRQPGQPFFHVFNIGTTHESRVHFPIENLKEVTTTNPLSNAVIQDNHPATELFEYTNAYYRDKIQQMDAQVGAVLDELEKDTLLDNTFIFYYGDHGGVLPGSKGYLAETGLHVPLVVHVPSKYAHLVGEKIGGRSNAFVSFIDFGATILKLAGVEIPKGIDGKPFLVSAADQTEIPDMTFSYSDRMDEKYDMVRAVRKGKYKYVRNYQPFNPDALMNNYRYKQLAYQEWKELYEAGKLNKEQAAFFEPKTAEGLYDIEQDPFETQNLASDPTHLATLKDLRLELITWEKAMPDLSFYPEHYLIKNAFDNPVAFGKAHQTAIEQYIEVANLMLLDFEKAKPQLAASLKAKDPWLRYWALIAASSFGEQAVSLRALIEPIAKNDAVLCNRVRAAEFLGITKLADPAPLMLDAFYQTTDPVEGLLILNSVVLMRDHYGYAFQFDKTKLEETLLEEGLVLERLKYLGVM